MQPKLIEFLSSGEIERIRHHSLEILEDTGIRVSLQRMRHLLADHGCRVDENSMIVRFPAELVDASIKKAPSEFVICGAAPDVQFPVGPGKRVWSGLGTAFRMLNPEDGTHRDAKHQDVEKHLILF